MDLYTFDDRSKMGHHGIDAVHKRIADLSTELSKLVEENAGFDRIFTAFVHLKDALVGHFYQEEQIFHALPDSPEARQHIKAHTADHMLFRDLFTYAEGQFNAQKDSGEIPNITALIPQKYFEELKNLDAELAQLLKASKHSQ